MRLQPPEANYVLPSMLTIARRSFELQIDYIAQGNPRGGVLAGGRSIRIDGESRPNPRKDKKKTANREKDTTSLRCWPMRGRWVAISPLLPNERRWIRSAL